MSMSIPSLLVAASFTYIPVRAIFIIRSRICTDDTGKLFGSLQVQYTVALSSGCVTLRDINWLDELSYTAAGAWKTIYGHRNVEMEKNLKGAGLLPPLLRSGQARSIVTAERHQHARMRKTVAHAFSEKALREQEGFLQGYVDILINQLRQKSLEEPQNLVDWFNYTTFDVIGDMSFGEPFGCLQSNTYHTWVANVFQGVKQIPYVHLLMYLKITWLVTKLTPKRLRDAKNDSDADAYEKVSRRIALQKEGTNRKDFLSYMLRENHDSGMTVPELQETAVILIIAGSETTATFLSGTVYLILRNPRVYQRLVEEVRSSFQDEAEITITAVQGLKYMKAVVSESFRVYPPSPGSFPRIVPGMGERIMGKWVPGGVGVHQLAANHDERNFYRPNDFLPERYLPDVLHQENDVASERFVNDKLDVVKPFSFGPRNCLGKNLAYAELRLILTRLVWNFDMKLDPDSNHGRWIADQKTAMIWEKPPLKVQLTDIHRK
ncbi:hypothetical protein FNAPI_5854 [Fusarium napiforme]|uniref:Cytochrome P450 monooxygenase n=1 Tax=Fusarium napiforme TaxID=42672 RepID=A0A8H5JIM5_9HYPO|nr:hypothetical protein FNAPI_5854 [Fusarium napiforme]